MPRARSEADGGPALASQRARKPRPREVIAARFAGVRPAIEIVDGVLPLNPGFFAVQALRNSGKVKRQVQG